MKSCILLFKPFSILSCEPGENMTDSELERLLALSDPAAIAALYADAYQVKLEYVGKRVSIRGLIEISNICRKNCYYCGIRSGNGMVARFRISREEILETALWAHRHHFASLVLQSGEVASEAFTSFIEEIVREICVRTENGMGITLSLGEQTRETYRRWRDAGATRYLLRIEASDPELYRKLHPADHSYEARTECLRILRELDYQVGSGVMIGLPGQTVWHLVKDLRFFQAYDIDMIGMGPYIPHEDTPLGAGIVLTEDYRKHQLELGLKMIACARLLLRDVNIASTTALQALDPKGRELGLLAGANVIMPNLTDTAYRSGYRLYAGKPGLDESSELSLEALSRSVEGAGETILWNARGDSRHYFRRHEK